MAEGQENLVRSGGKWVIRKGAEKAAENYMPNLSVGGGDGFLSSLWGSAAPGEAASTLPSAPEGFLGSLWGAAPGTNATSVLAPGSTTSGITGIEGLGTQVPNVVGGAPAVPGAAPLGSTVLPLAAVAYGANALKQSLIDKKELSTTQKLAMALPTAGLSLIPGVGKKIGSLFGDKDRWATEGGRLKKLAGQGYDVSHSDGQGMKAGRSKQQLIDIEKAKAAAGQYSNEKFAGSRNESDLTGQDVQGFASIVEKAGKDASLADRIALGQRVIDAGAGREHHGTYDVDWSKINLGDPKTPKLQALPGNITPEQARKFVRK